MSSTSKSKLLRSAARERILGIRNMLFGCTSSRSSNKHHSCSLSSLWTSMSLWPSVANNSVTSSIPSDFVRTSSTVAYSSSLSSDAASTVKFENTHQNKNVSSPTALAKGAATVQNEKILFQYGNVEVLSTAQQPSRNMQSTKKTADHGRDGYHGKQQQQYGSIPRKKEVLQLEGDAFYINSHDVCRTLYRLTTNDDEETANLRSSCPFEIDERYNIKQATKEFVLRKNDHYCDGAGAKNILVTDGSKRQKEDKMEDEDFVTLGRPVDRLNNIYINEIDQQGGMFGSSAGTGGTTWESSIVMSLFFSVYPHLLMGDVLELGSGVGLGAIMTHHTVQLKKNDVPSSSSSNSHKSNNSYRNDVTIKSVTLTDGNMEVLQQCQYNLYQKGMLLNDKLGVKDGIDYNICDDNDREGSARRQQGPREGGINMNTLQLNWHSPHLMYDVRGKTYDTIVASDCVYLYPDVKAFAKTVATLLKKKEGSPSRLSTDSSSRHDASNHHMAAARPPATFHYFGPSNRAPLQDLVKELNQRHQMQVTISSPLTMTRYRLKDDEDGISESNLFISKVASSHPSTFVHIEATHSPNTQEDDDVTSTSCTEDATVIILPPPTKC